MRRATVKRRHGAFKSVIFESIDYSRRETVWNAMFPGQELEWEPGTVREIVSLDMGHIFNPTLDLH